jgi:hypothetical protein
VDFGEISFDEINKCSEEMDSAEMYRNPQKY